MNNFPITHGGKTYWISRSMAISCFVITSLGGEWCILANKRGKNTPDFQGCWNCPCGYLDYNETTAEAAIRETYEETGLRLKSVKFWMFNDSVTENRQNVTFRYYAIISDPQLFALSKYTHERGGEKDEVDKVAWIPISDLDHMEWAFDHDQIIKKLIKELGLDQCYYAYFCMPFYNFCFYA